MQEDWKKMIEKLDRIEQLLLRILRQGDEKDVGNENVSLLSLKQAADFMHLSESSIYKLIYKKKLIPVQRKLRSRILFTQEHLINYLKKSNRN